jgi:hypothetical protein
MKKNLKFCLKSSLFARIRRGVKKQTVLRGFLKGSTLIHILSQFKPHHTSIRYIKIHFNIISLPLVNRVTSLRRFKTIVFLFMAHTSVTQNTLS